MSNQGAVMSLSLLLLCGSTMTLLIGLAGVRYLRPPLHKQLQELCGNAERAEFWTAFSNVTVALVPVIFALQCPPEIGVPPVLAVVGQLQWGLVGLAVSVLMLGWILSRLIPRNSAHPAAIAGKAGAA